MAQSAAMDEALLKSLLKDIPKITDNELPPIAERVGFLEEQIEQLKKIIYRTVCELESAKFFAGLDDANAVSVANSRIPEISAQLNGQVLQIRALRRTRFGLQDLIPKETKKKK